MSANPIYSCISPLSGRASKRTAAVRIKAESNRIFFLFIVCGGLCILGWMANVLCMVRIPKVMHYTPCWA